MKHLLLGLALIFMGTISSQTLQAVNANIQTPVPQASFSGINQLTKSQICGPDTVGYALAKSTGFESLNINNATSASAFGQYFDAPQSLSISGVSFYAYKIDLVGGPTMNCNVEIYAAAPDSTPVGNPLVTTTVLFDTTFAPGTLDTLRKHATFTTPLTVTSPYVVVISNPTATQMGAIFNSWTAADGAQEWLSSALIGTNWLRGYALSIGGTPLDSDGLIEPHVSYNLNASYLIDDPCFASGLTLNFTNMSSLIGFNRMYNQAEYQSTPEASFTWNYGDASPTANFVDAAHTYATAGNYDVKLTDTIFGWTTNCSTDTVVTIGPNLVAAFTFIDNSPQFTFTNSSTAAGATTYFWEFGDGNTSTLMDPSHTYAADGNYQVCLTISDQCIDSTCQTVSVLTCTNPVAGFTTASTSPTFDFTNTSTTSGTAIFAWDFGDGNNATTTDASNTYSANGTYTVTLSVNDSCGSNIFIDTILVNTLGIDKLSLLDIIVYPNPSKGIFTIKAPAEMKSSLITDLTGKTVYTGSLSGNEAIINTGDLRSGTYFLSIRYADGMNQMVRLEVAN